MKFLRSIPAVATLVAAAFLSTACSNGDGAVNIPSGAIPDEKPSAPAQPTGTIRGHVLLKGDLPKPGTDKINQDQTTCGNEVSLPRIAVGDDKGIQDTFVFLEGVPASEGTRPAPTTKTILIDQKNCQYTPHSLIVPFGSTVEMVNSDPIFHNVHGTQDGSGVFNMAQPQQGTRSTVDTKNMKLGIVTLTCEAGHPWMNAFMYVTKDPYVALTGKGGEFVIKDVPPGTYTIKMWHEGVQLKKIHKMLQQYEYEAPYEMTQQVTVTANAESTVNFDLTLRK
jgi:plastocyanin